MAARKVVGANLVEDLECLVGSSHGEDVGFDEENRCHAVGVEVARTD